MRLYEKRNEDKTKGRGVSIRSGSSVVEGVRCLVAVDVAAGAVAADADAGWFRLACWLVYYGVLCDSVSRMAFHSAALSPAIVKSMVLSKKCASK